MFQDTPDGVVCGEEEGASGRRHAKRLCLEIERQFVLISKSENNLDRKKYTDAVKVLCERLVKALSKGGDASKPCECLESRSSATPDAHNSYESHHCRSFYVDILQVLSESSLHGYTECMKGLHAGTVDACVACLESMWSIYGVFCRDGKSGLCPYITFGCLVYLLQVYDCFPSESLDDRIRDHQKKLLDEIVEVLARMNNMKPLNEGDVPPFWYEFMIRGHLIVSKESKNELVENNCISTAKRILAECYDHLMPDEKVRACSVVALHHYEKASSLEESGDCTRSSIRHCDQSLKLIENVIDHVEVLEHSYELMTLMYQVRLLKAKALLRLGEIKNASAEVSRIPSLQQGEDRIRILIGFEVLFLRVRICARLNEPLKCFAYLGKDVTEAISLLKEGSDTLEKITQLLGCLLEEIILAFPLVRDQSIPESFSNLLRVTPNVGVDAFMVFVNMLQSAPEPCDFAVPLLVDIISDDRIVNIVVKKRYNMDVCQKAFQKISFELFLKGKIDVCILFQQACLNYGPITKRQWSFTLLIGLYVFSKNWSMAEQCFDQLQKASMRQPLVVLMRLVRMFEQEDGDVNSSQIRDVVLSSDSKYHDIQWSREHLQAMDEITAFYNSPLQHPSDLLCQSQGMPYDSIVDGNDHGPLATLDTLVRFLEKENDLPETFGADLNHIVDAAMHATFDESSKQACPVFAKITRLAQGLRTAQCGLDDSPSEKRVRVMLGSSQCLAACLCILEKAPYVVRNSKKVKEMLHHAQCQALTMLANEYLDISFFSSQKEETVSVLDQTMEAMKPFDNSENASLALLKFRHSILKGETNILNEASMQYIQSLLGDECSAQFIMHHIASPRIPMVCIPKLVQSVSRQYQGPCDIWRDILRLTFQQQDTCRTFSIISNILRVSERDEQSAPVACMVKQVINSHPSPDKRLMAKLCHETPWIFREFAAGHHSKSFEEKHESKRIKTGTRQEYDDALEENKQVSHNISESQPVSNHSSSHSSPHKDTGIWGTWIQKVLRRHV